MLIVLKGNIYGRVIRVLEATNFVNTSNAAKKAKIDRSLLIRIKENKQFAIKEEQLSQILTSFGIPKTFLSELKDLEKKLETHLKDQTDIPQEKRELLILQALAHKVLSYYFTSNQQLLKITPSPKKTPPEKLGLNRILRVIFSINFISKKEASAITDIAYNSLTYILSKKTTPRKETLENIIKGFNIPEGTLYNLQLLEHALEQYFKDKNDIAKEEKELLILQALEFKLLTYLIEEATKRKQYPEDILQRKKRNT